MLPNPRQRRHHGIFCAWIVLLAALVPAACTGAATPPAATPQPAPPSIPGTTPPPATVVQPGAPGQPSRTAGVGAPAAARSHTAADVRFMQGMIMHHAQALEMTALVASHTKDRDIMLISRRIDVSQQDEIVFMRSWLQARREPAEMPKSHAAGASHDVHMPGMLSADQMRQLGAARDAAFDRLFLTFMIQHHEGALKMVEHLVAVEGAAQEPAMFQFVSHIDADQRAEIARMRALLQ